MTGSTPSCSAISFYEMLAARGPRSTLSACPSLFIGEIDSLGRSIEKLMAAVIEGEFDPKDRTRPVHFQRQISVGARSRKWPRPR